MERHRNFASAARSGVAQGAAYAGKCRREIVGYRAGRAGREHGGATISEMRLRIGRPRHAGRAVDLALADLALGQAALDGFEQPANWTFEDLRIYVQSLVLFNPFDRRLANIEGVAGALRDGRQRIVDGATNQAEFDRALHGAGVAPLRRADLR